MESYTEIYTEPKGSIIGGIIGALIGALLGAVVWALVGLMGYIASVVGLLIAFLASKGYDLLHGRPGACKLITLIICIILAVVLGTLGTACIEIHQVYVEENYSLYVGEAEFFQFIVPMLMEDADWVSAMTKDTLIGLFFAALGAFGLLHDSGKKHKPAQNADIAPNADAIDDFGKIVADASDAVGYPDPSTNDQTSDDKE